ncbi:hypothetical protein [Pedobacter sp. Leaf132]|uniref:hypothetical protein n=1 Tax=Pedobacter sp. Leaf132 TaxID=2876557 RepID=UPI001E51AD73|nr:hypothetical protein [Pedobacter sp. Leaf132]
MKKIAIAFLAVIMFPYGCKVLKTKTIDKSFEQSRIINEVYASTLKIDSLKSEQSTSKIKSNEFMDEEISLKNNSPLENITISANFKLDSGALLKDTIKLVDIKNNGITLSIFQKGKEVMATVTTPTSTHTTPFSEINIKRKSGKSNVQIDSLATFENHSELTVDTANVTLTDKKSKYTTIEKIKESKPNVWIWLFGLILLSALIYAVIRKR